MSQEEIHIGKLRKIAIHSSVEEWAESKCKLDNIEKASYNNNWLEQLRDSYYEKYFIVNGNIYEAFDHKEFDYEDIYYLKDNGDNTFDFVMKFYNGGTCLEECIEEELEKILK
jgi:hypothetical protein